MTVERIPEKSATVHHVDEGTPQKACKLAKSHVANSHGGVEYDQLNARHYGMDDGQHVVCAVYTKFQSDE